MSADSMFPAVIARSGAAGARALGVAVVLSICGSAVRSEDAKPPAPAKEAVEDAAAQRKERFLKWMTQHAFETDVLVPDAAGGPPQPATRVEKPLFRYFDEEHRIPDATLWVWTHAGRPVAFQKVDGNNFASGRAGTICFASVSERLITAKWRSHGEFKATKPGVTFRPIPDAPEPSDNPRLRASQIKSLKDRFTARMGNGTQAAPKAARTLPKPMYEYFAPETKMPVGAVFAMTSTGTNPNFLLLIEARPESSGKLRWEFAHARMTGSAVEFLFDDKVVLAEKGIGSGDFGNWTFYHMGRDFE
jgi:hypothetical protein